VNDGTKQGAPVRNRRMRRVIDGKRQHLEAALLVTRAGFNVAHDNADLVGVVGKPRRLQGACT